MISCFLKEQKRYTQKDLCDKLACPVEKVVPIIRKLKEFGVLKAVKADAKQLDMSDLLEEDTEIIDVDIDEHDYLYVFTFVGVIVISGRVLKCYPKYIIGTDTPKQELCQVIKVIEKLNSKEQIIRMFNETDEHSSFNLLAVLLFLIQDYYENGIYSNEEEVIESNGSGDILWDRTINETFTMIFYNRPYYTDLQTKKRISNDFDFFKRLHECILTKTSKELKNADLMDLLEITEIDLTDEDLDEFGEKDYILYRIEKELNTQFNTRKQLLLKTMYAYISHNGSLYDADCVSLIGTNSFNLVWEKVCAEILDNQLDVELRNLKLPISLKDEYDGNLTLKELIEKPYWSASGMTAQDTLIPDLITISANHFYIFDAKYYTAKLNPGIPPKGQPGIESVTKQYLYQLAYQRFIADHGFSSVTNCFVMPTENDSVELRGEASMKMLSELGLQSIKVRFLPAELAYDCYLSGKNLNMGVLKL